MLRVPDVRVTTTVTARGRTTPFTRVARPAAVVAAAVLAAVPAGASAAPPLAIPGTVVASGGFETGSLSQWSGIARVKARSITVVRKPVREGRFAARFEVRNGENPIGFGDRAQIQIDTGEREGQTRWYSWSTRVAKDFPRYRSFQVLAQWHARAGGSPPIAFFAEGDDLVLRLHRHAAPGRVIDIRDIWRGPLPRGEWRDIRMQVRWSGDDRRGWVRLWIDGRPQRFDNGALRRRIRTMYPGIGNYFTMGYYRQSGLSRPGIVFHDGFRMSRG